MQRTLNLTYCIISNVDIAIANKRCETYPNLGIQIKYLSA